MYVAKSIVDFDVNKTASYPPSSYATLNFLSPSMIQNSSHSYSSISPSSHGSFTPSSHTSSSTRDVIPIITMSKNIHTTLAGELLSQKVFQDSENLFLCIMDILRSCIISDNMGILSN